VAKKDGDKYGGLLPGIVRTAIKAQIRSGKAPTSNSGPTFQDRMDASRESLYNLNPVNESDEEARFDFGEFMSAVGVGFVLGLFFSCVIGIPGIILGVSGGAVAYIGLSANWKRGIPWGALVAIAIIAVLTALVLLVYAAIGCSLTFNRSMLMYSCRGGPLRQL
jgi:hypothetical protein